VPAYLRYWSVAEALGMPGAPRSAQVPVGALERSWASELVGPLPRPILAIHPGGKWETKRWPPEKFAEIARRFEGSVVVIGSEAERAAAQIVQSVPARNGPSLNLAGCTTLKQLSALLAAVDLLVSNDSGPLHLAAALGTPVAGIFTCTSPTRSGPDPAGGLHELVSTGVPCAASYKKSCPFRGTGHLACLDELPVDRVWNAIVRILERRSLARPA
jgi:ADP-heptose:LPS heptosyltransferase